MTLAAAAALAALTVLRLVMAATMPLAPDEAYYWVWARALAPGYFDHPPMVALWVAFGSTLAGDTALGVRLLGPISAALGTLLLADAANRLLADKRAGLVAGALFNATLILGVGSVIMTPDSPLLLFWTATIWALTRVGAPMTGRPIWWLAAGLFGGLALASKYTAVFLGLGIALWLLVTPAMRPWLRRPGPWFGLALALLVFAPVVLWNADHDWAGFLRQGTRVTSWHAGRAAQFLGELIGGQAGLATPGIWLLSLGGMAAAATRFWRDRDPGWTLLACLTLPAALYMVWHAMGARVQGNWPAIIYPATLIAAAGLVVGGGLPGPWSRLFRPSVALGLAICGLTYLQAATNLFPLPVRVDPIALRLADWDRVRDHVAEQAQRTGATFVASDQYALAATLAWILPQGVTVFGIEDRWRLFNLPRGHPAGQTGILVRDSRDQTVFDPRLWRSATRVSSVDRGTVQSLHLFLVVSAGDDPSAVSLPRPALR